VFAGAVRETVFANPEVIRRVRAAFVPVAVRAADMEQPRSDAEGRLFQSIRRSRLVPQGLAILNKDGQVLQWTLMYDDNKAVLDALDHALQRFRQFPDAKQPVVTERYMRYPSQRAPDFNEEARPSPQLALHTPDSPCISSPRLPEGILAAQVIGRALDKNGQYSPDTRAQEHYIEDQFSLPPDLQAELLRRCAQAGTERVELPEGFAWLVATHAYLGHLDVQPLDNPLGGHETRPAQIKFWAQPIRADGQRKTLRVEGTSEVESQLDRPDSGFLYSHNVRLAWEGFIELDGPRIRRLLLSAEGTERLRWGSEPFLMMARTQSPTAYLPAGHPISLETAVRYGILMEPVASSKTPRGLPIKQ